MKSWNRQIILFNACTFPLNNCTMFSFTAVKMEAKIETVKARTLGKRGIFSSRKICTNLILLCSFYSPLPRHTSQE